MRFIILTALLMTLATFKGSAEGCAAFRIIESTKNQSKISATDKWLLNINRRYYKSSRYFTRTAEQKQSAVMGMDVYGIAAL